MIFKRILAVLSIFTAAIISPLNLVVWVVCGYSPSMALTRWAMRIVDGGGR